ncbi:hypothetical protein COOONC_08140 [Cooperia oncophora]
MYPTITCQVIGDEFLTDPCRLDHECRPEKYVRERGDRAVYEELKHVREDSKYAAIKPVQVFFDLVAQRREADNEPEKMGESLSYDGKCAGGVPQASMMALRFCNWTNRGSTFISPPGTIQMARENGLYGTVADGSHSLQPKTLGRYAQLYCVHGVCNQDLDVPLMFCIMEKKTRRGYKRVFEHLKRSLLGETPRRIVLDFEKAAIHAANKVFPNATVEGCAFHLAQAWNRKRNHLGLQRYLKGAEKDERVVNWWETLKGSVNFFVHCVQINSTYISAGMVFLPQDLWPEVRALRGPPVPSGDLHDRCQDFLNYLETTWLSGPFKDLWCKWRVEELRTTNLAEAFHRRIQVLASVDPPTAKRSDRYFEKAQL